MIIDEEVYLEHFGVKGMKWGVRKEARAGVSRRTDREASKDAKEFARAKMYFGEGAGTRRKLIKNTVEAKKKRDSSYAKAFDRHLDNQDMSTHASRARSERSRRDTRQGIRQRAGYVARRITGEQGTRAAFTAAVIGGAAYLNSPAGRRRARQTLDQLQTAANRATRSRGARQVDDFFRSMNFGT